MTETSVVERPKATTVPRYTEAEIQRALVEVAACSGNTHKAARNLKEDVSAPAIAQKTLWEWSRRSKVQEYDKLRAEALPQITALATEQHMALARQQMELAQAAAGFVATRLDRMEDKDLINAMGKADIGSGIHTEKAQLLSGQPTAIVQREASEVLRKLKSRGVVIDAVVVEEETLGETDSGVLGSESSAEVVAAETSDPLA
jgi:hypothetical protein